MIADAHYHLDPRLESIERLLAQMQAHGIGRVALIAAVCDSGLRAEDLDRVLGGNFKALAAV